MLERGSTVLLLAHSQFRGVYVGTARKLKNELDANVHLYTATSQESDYYYQRHSDIFASITVSGALYDTCRQPITDEAAVLLEAQRNEEEFGITFNELSVSDRHLGRGYALGGFKHPRSHISEETSYVQMLNGYNSVIDFWRRELEDKKPALILNASKILCVLARSRDVPVRILTGARYKNYYYWGVNEFRENPAIAAAYARATNVGNHCLDTPYTSHLQFRSRFRKEASVWSTIKRAGVMVARNIYWKLRHYEKARGYYLREQVSYLWRRYRIVRAMTSRSLPDISGFKRQPFAFFPLATEPETALQSLSPEYLYQLPAIASIARNLPAGAELVVKEHYAAVGRRPTDFYAQIREFKNVRFMNMAELGLKAAQASRVIVTISGTSGFEGAASGIPVITFGRHNTYNFLPHVMVVTDEAQIKSYLEKAFSKEFDTKAASRDGRRFLQAIIDVSFDLDNFRPISPNKISANALETAFDTLYASLSPATSSISAFDASK